PPRSGRSRLSLAIALVTMLPASNATSQTCASPVPIAFNSPVLGNTCNSTNQLPYLVNGAIAASGSQDIYRVTVLDGRLITLYVEPVAGVDLAVFVCPNECSTYSSCIIAADSEGAGGVETAALPDGPGDYYVIVGATAALTCGGYSLTW